MDSTVDDRASGRRKHAGGRGVMADSDMLAKFFETSPARDRAKGGRDGE